MFRSEYEGVREGNKYGTVQELRSTFSHTKSINIDFSFVCFVSSYVEKMGKTKQKIK